MPGILKGDDTDDIIAEFNIKLIKRVHQIKKKKPVETDRLQTPREINHI